MTGHMYLVHSADHPPDGPFQADGFPAVLTDTITYVGADDLPVTTVTPDDLPAHLRRFGTRPCTTAAAGDDLIATLDHAALTGHGGAHFPTATKWRAHRRAGGGGTVVANGAESEPDSAKDRALLEFRPHLVLDGLLAAAETLAADDVVVWTHQSADQARHALRRALAERRAAGHPGPPVRLVTGPDHYLAGESGAIRSVLAGGPPLPGSRVHKASATRGTATRGTTTRDAAPPTLVHNVETLALVGLLCRPGHYRPTRLLTVAHGADRTVVTANPADTLADLIPARSSEPAAVLLGGYGGTWHPWPAVAHRPISDLQLGAGVVLPVAADECGLAHAARIASYLADSSAGQCGPCLFGLRSVSDALDSLVAGNSRSRDLPRLQRFLAEITGRGACHHPDGAVRMVASALTTFAADLDTHLHAGHCANPPRRPSAHRAATR